MINRINLADCSLQDLVKAINIALELAKLSDVQNIEVYVKGTFKDRKGELVFSNSSWLQVNDVTHLSRKNKFFNVDVDNIKIDVTNTENFDIVINI